MSDPAKLRLAQALPDEKARSLPRETSFNTTITRSLLLVDEHLNAEKEVDSKMSKLI